MDKMKLGAKPPQLVLPVVVMGANLEGKPNYCTVAWVTIIDDDPPAIGLVLGKGRRTMDGARENGTFSVNVPGTASAAAVDHCGLVSGHKQDKSEAFTAFYGVLGTAPMAKECPMNAECRLRNIVEFEGTNLVVGDVVELYVDRDCLVDGKPDARKIDPLLYVMLGGPYLSMGDKVADAFKVGKDFQGKRPAGQCGHR